MTLGETESVLFGITFSSNPYLSVVFWTNLLQERALGTLVLRSEKEGPAFQKIAITENLLSNQTFNFLILR